MQRTFLPLFCGIICEMRAQEARSARYQNRPIQSQILSSDYGLTFKMARVYYWAFYAAGKESARRSMTVTAQPSTKILSHWSDWLFGAVVGARDHSKVWPGLAYLPDTEVPAPGWNRSPWPICGELERNALNAI